MFLISLIIAFPLFAQETIPLQTGLYHLKSGDSTLCGKSVEILKEDLQEKRFEIGRMVFEFKTGSTTTPDPGSGCNSYDDVKITQTKSSAVLSRTIIDKCQGKAPVTVKSEVTLSGRSISLKQTDTDSYQCVWTKR